MKKTYMLICILTAFILLAAGCTLVTELPDTVAEVAPGASLQPNAEGSAEEQYVEITDGDYEVRMTSSGRLQWRVGDGEWKYLSSLDELEEKYPEAFAPTPSPTPEPTPEPTPKPTKKPSAKDESTDDYTDYGGGIPGGGGGGGTPGGGGGDSGGGGGDYSDDYL